MAALAELNPEIAAGIIDSSKGGVDLVLRVREALDAGSVVGLMVDRARAGRAHRRREFSRRHRALSRRPLAAGVRTQGAGGDGVRRVARRRSLRGSRRDARVEEVELPRANRDAALHARGAGLRGPAGHAGARARPTIGSTSSTSGRHETACDRFVHRDQRGRPRPRRAHRGAARRNAPGSPQQTLRGRRAGVLDRRGRGARVGARCRARSRPSTAATTGWRNCALGAGRLSRRGRRGARAYGARRIGVFIGTSTSGVRHTELAYRERGRARENLPDWFDYRTTQNTYSIADFARARLGLDGPRVGGFRRLRIERQGVRLGGARASRPDSATRPWSGGVDSLCLTTLYGFNSLQLVSPEICRPADAGAQGACRSARRAASRCSTPRAGAAARPRASAAANPATRTTCRSRARTARSRRSRCARALGELPTGARRATSTCTARRRPPTTRPRMRR